ncbi:MAG: hypothetical protein A2087_09960 [Spirochaetes bacterium GWD1_61_31]|nr:MAG: hypothetical protein A2Y37_01780 [Spirochaetes bacterium GWB1_60_80]OHD32741.1 MAG: hypothetical protein A2004_06650 [Spirochaetes bacterium GWC1_61_12]OHD40607.1 MAG: hypothetical protein A2087_09960 [Spirochaetes bacterium GWD1_61_31]OHD43879.1 MAG: hypothetical protein A2Y35_12310 [Spirochaetes bacterium GWE1_60_18]OHD59750.1 MAG: hypothetical protein A2Y32_02165 [Spirochaetes bacterium GWF1_60_12]HAP43529.1 hypothetical protein [Spirochaetaceae bacterium]
MALIELIQESLVKVPLTAAHKDDIIRELIEVLASAGRITDSVAVYKAVLARESLGSTGLTDGIAIPHGKTTAVADLAIAVGVAPAGIDFDSMDGQPSRIFFLIIAPPDKSGPHIEALAEIAHMVQSASFRRAMLGSRNAAEVVELIRGD